MALFSIKDRLDGSVLFEIECDSLKVCVEEAVKVGANLAGAYLAGAKLARANLACAYLAGADLSGADLAAANLTCAYLAGADLSGANLACAYLAGVTLAGADLTGATLAGAILAGAKLARATLAGATLAGAKLARANLACAYLAGADLSGADFADAVNIPPSALRATRADLFDVLLRAIPEVPALLAALREGRVDGSTYEGGCACLCGTIANVRGVNVDALDFRDAGRPIETWFYAIEKGDTPENNASAKQAEKWIVEFMELVGIADAVRTGGR